ncbi:MAG: tRNA pseudouridine(13) synthase TruD [Phycisphaerales bacterium]|nr:tRNA pseudouridine(13) synthase TruD [Phycisphaerales bacterium]
MIDVDKNFDPGFAPAGGQAGIGGRLRDRPEDFLVEEIPLYQPSGEGEHIYLFVEKRGLSTLEMVGVISKHFGVRRRDVGYAGLKDKAAITRQMVSVWTPGRKIEDFPMLRHDRVGVLWADRHANKLRPGHLKGNRFSIRVRGVGIQATLVAQRVMDRLSREGLANRIGPQRFGFLGNNHLVGRAIVLERWSSALDHLLGPSASRPDAQVAGRRMYAEGRFAEAIGEFHGSLRTERTTLHALASGATPEEAVRSMDPSALAYFVTAFQSAVFNAVLARREDAGTLDALLEGDVAFMHASLATFMVAAPELADPEMPGRIARFEVSPSGPIWGVSMRRAGGLPGECELDALLASGVDEAALVRFERDGGPVEGARRPLRVPVIDPEVEGGMDEHGAFVRCAFELPRGCFATAVMREIMGPDGPAEAGPLEE